MQVFILRGVSGSGKSTIAATIAAHYGAAMCRTVSADKYFHLPHWNGGDRATPCHLPREVYDFNSAELKFAHAYCMREYLNALHDGIAHTITVDNTSTTWGEISPYVLVAQAYRAQVVIVNVQTDVETAISRNVHDVPAGAIRAMAERLLEPLPPFAPTAVNIWGDMPLDIFGDLSEVPAEGGLSILEDRGHVASAVYDDAPYAGHQDDDGNWVYTRQAIVIR